MKECDGQRQTVCKTSFTQLIYKDTGVVVQSDEKNEENKSS